MKIIIVGKGIGWDNAPPLSLDYQVLGITQCNLRREFDRVIDMNDYSDNRWGEEETEGYLASKELTKAKSVPYIDLEHYPLEKVIEFFGTDYFSNTVDYAIALAIYEGYTEIDLYGINMAVGSEYEFEKPGVDFWCGVAIGKGVKVTVHGNRSMIMKTKDGLLYGYYYPQKCWGVGWK